MVVRKFLGGLYLSIVLIEGPGFMALCLADFQHNCCNWLSQNRLSCLYSPDKWDDYLNEIFSHLQSMKTVVPIWATMLIFHNCSAVNEKSVRKGNEISYWTLKFLKTISMSNHIWFISIFFTITTSYKITILPNNVCTHQKLRVKGFGENTMDIASEFVYWPN